MVLERVRDGTWTSPTRLPTRWACLSHKMIAALVLALPAVLAANSTVYIIRHGEKTWGGGCLNIQGQERMNNLFNVFPSANFSTPTAIFANKYNDQTNCERCWLTIQSLAQHLKLPVNFEYGYPKALGGNKAAANAIKDAAKTNKVILVSWEHVNIQFLSADLGVPKSKIPYWKGSDYDTVYELTLDADTGKLTEFVVKAQNYVPKSTTCPPHYKPPPGGAGYTAPEDDEVLKSPEDIMEEVLELVEE